jgi:ribonuclease PH
MALDKLVAKGEIEKSPIVKAVAAVSVGAIAGELFLDLNYQEDVAADVDFNVVMTDNLELIEVQGTAESGSYNRTQLNRILDLAEMGIKDLLEAQSQALIVERQR